MSVTSPSARATRTTSRPAERPRPVRLQVVTPPPARRSPLPFAAWCTALLVTSLLALLVLNISLSHGAYEVHDLQQEATRLGEREQELRERLAAQAAPAQLAVEARELGMVPSSSPAFIRLSDGTVLGTPQPAESVPVPEVAVGTWKPPAAPGTASAQSSGAAVDQTSAVAGEPVGSALAAGSDALVTEEPTLTSATATERAAERTGATSVAAASGRPVGDGAVIVRGTP